MLRPTRLFVILVWLFLLCIFLFEWRINFAATLKLVLHSVVLIPLTVVGLCFCASLSNYLLRFYRWDLYLRSRDHHLSVAIHLPIYIAGFSFTLTPGKVGEAMRSGFLLKHAVPLSDSISVFIVERLFDLLAMMALAMLVIGLWRDGVLPLTFVGVLVAVFTSLLVHPDILLRLLDSLRFYIPRRLLPLFEKVHSSIESTRALVRYQYVRMLVLSVLAWGIEGVGLWLLASSFHHAISLPIVVGIYAAAVLIGVVTFLPGGLGGTEVAMGSLLVMAGLNAAEAAVCTIVCRVATLWFAIGLGLLALPFASQSKQKEETP